MYPVAGLSLFCIGLITGVAAELGWLTQSCVDLEKNSRNLLTNGVGGRHVEGIHYK